MMFSKTLIARPSIRALASVLALTALSSYVARAHPYAANVTATNGAGLVAFVLNERGDPSVAVDNTLLTQSYDGIIVIGDSPVLRRNAARNNRGAGVRILSFQPLRGPSIASNPFLDGNVLDGNTSNDPVRGVYRVKREEVEK